MSRILTLALFLSACSGADAPPRNLVCERVATINPKAPCVPEMSDVGEQHTHTARVTLDKATVVCALNAGQISMVCGDLEQTSKPAETTGAAK